MTIETEARPKTEEELQADSRARTMLEDLQHRAVAIGSATPSDWVWDGLCTMCDDSVDWRDDPPETKEDAICYGCVRLVLDLAVSELVTTLENLASEQTRTQATAGQAKQWAEELAQAQAEIARLTHALAASESRIRTMEAWEATQVPLLREAERRVKEAEAREERMREALGALIAETAGGSYQQDRARERALAVLKSSTAPSGGSVQHVGPTADPKSMHGVEPQPEGDHGADDGFAHVPSIVGPGVTRKGKELVAHTPFGKIPAVEADASVYATSPVPAPLDVEANEWGCEGRRLLGIARGALSETAHARRLALIETAMPQGCPELEAARAEVLRLRAAFPKCACCVPGTPNGHPDCSLCGGTGRAAAPPPEELRTAVIAYIEHWSLEHDDGCPADDTCSCPLVRAVEKALHRPGCSIRANGRSCTEGCNRR